MKCFETLILGFSLILTLTNAENCDYFGHLIYQDIGCKPVLKEGHDCPVKYDCNFEVQNNTCTFRGRTIALHQELTSEDTYAACIIGCHCQETNKFRCAVLDCPEWLGVPVKFLCYRKYAVGKCCSVGQICPPESMNPFKCLRNGATSIEGERYYPENTCLECVCNKGYEGKDEAPFCKRQNCAAQVRNSDKISKYCAPVYGGDDDRVLCCPDNWVCPSKNDKPLPPNPKADSSSDLTCKFGDKTLKLGERIQGEYEWYDQSIRQAPCECIVPPLLTCREIPRPPTPPPATLDIRPIPISRASTEKSTE